MRSYYRSFRDKFLFRVFAGSYPELVENSRNLSLRLGSHTDSEAAMLFPAFENAFRAGNI